MKRRSSVSIGDAGRVSRVRQPVSATCASRGTASPEDATAAAAAEAAVAAAVSSSDRPGIHGVAAVAVSSKYQWEIAFSDYFRRNVNYK